MLLERFLEWAEEAKREAMYPSQVLWRREISPSLSRVTADTLLPLWNIPTTPQSIPMRGENLAHPAYLHPLALPSVHIATIEGDVGECFHLHFYSPLVWEICELDNVLFGIWMYGKCP